MTSPFGEFGEGGRRAGIVGVISSFNFPLVLSIRSIAAALAFGNAVVHKPDPRTPISAGIIIARCGRLSCCWREPIYSLIAKVRQKRD